MRLAAGVDLYALCVACASVEEVMAEWASLTAGTEYAKGEHDTLAVRIGELVVAALTRNGVLGESVRSVRLLKGRTAAGKDRASTLQARAREALDNISKLRALL